MSFFDRLYPSVTFPEVFSTFNFLKPKFSREPTHLFHTSPCWVPINFYLFSVEKLTETLVKIISVKKKAKNVYQHNLISINCNRFIKMKYFFVKVQDLTFNLHKLWFDPVAALKNTNKTLKNWLFKNLFQNLKFLNNDEISHRKTWKGKSGFAPVCL